MRNLALLIMAGLSLSGCITSMSTDITSNSSSQVITEYPIETAIMNIYSKERLDTLSVIIEGEPIVVTTKVMPKENKIFNHHQVLGAATSHFVTSAKEADYEITSIYYFTLNPLKFYGFTNSLDNYAITTQTANIPKLASVGDSDNFGIDNIYTDSSKDTLVSTYTKTWTLSRDSSNTAWLCIDTSLWDNPNNTTSNCYLINNQGELLGSKASFSYSTAEGMEIISYGS